MVTGHRSGPKKILSIIKTINSLVLLSRKLMSCLRVIESYVLSFYVLCLDTHLHFVPITNNSRKLKRYNYDVVLFTLVLDRTLQLRNHILFYKL